MERRHGIGRTLIAMDSPVSVGPEAALRYFNERLFENALPEMELNFSVKSFLKGFYCPAGWFGEEEEDIDEFSMNPAVLRLPPREGLSVLVHKMCHYWQFGHGHPGRRARHDDEWADKMIEIGLLPCSAPKHGITLPGQRVGHSIVRGGRFDQACDQMPQDALLTWTSIGFAEHTARKAASTETPRIISVGATSCIPSKATLSKEL